MGLLVPTGYFMKIHIDCTHLFSESDSVFLEMILNYKDGRLALKRDVIALVFLQYTLKIYKSQLYSCIEIIRDREVITLF